jgi:hypothetical protein
MSSESEVPDPAVLRAADIGEQAIAGLFARYGLGVDWLPAVSPIPSSFWGEPEAGVVGRRVFVRDDTPIHSLLHEACHIICMPEIRRANLDRDAGGDDLEESAVCYLQILLADFLPGVGAERLMSDMNAWGYSFRLGSTRRWFEDDASDAREWLMQQGLVTPRGVPVFQLRAG